MKGYFGIGVEGLSKPLNAGNLFRSAQAFGASFLFTVGASYAGRGGGAGTPPLEMSRRALRGGGDTSHAPGKVPLYAFPDAGSMVLPRGCALVGVELLDEAVDLPSFRHPARAAYILGPERDSLSGPVLERCAHVVRIPTSFCVNVAMAGAIVMYDRVLTLGRFATRPLSPGGPPGPLAPHVHGKPKRRT
ncbi:MAG: RNA methyltransferase [Alphaproteobacteria bacterium]|nr:RNA methyltransferase [Alphaproteobacteria bacterium]